MSDSKVITKPLVPRILWEFCKYFHNLYIDRHRLFPVFHPKLSIFIDPNTVDESFKDLVFQHSIDILLVESPPGAIPRLAFDVYSGKTPPKVKKKQLLFDSLGIHYQAVDIDQLGTLGADLFDKVLADTPELDMLRDVMNDWQWNAMQELDKIASA